MRFYNYQNLDNEYIYICSVPTTNESEREYKHLENAGDRALALQAQFKVKRKRFQDTGFQCNPYVESLATSEIETILE